MATIMQSNDNEAIDRFLAEVFGGAEVSAAELTAHRRLLRSAVATGETDRDRLKDMLETHSGLRRTLSNDNFLISRTKRARAETQRAKDNDTSGARRRERETKDRNELI